MNSQNNRDLTPWPSWATERVEIVEYDPTWPERGERERDQLHELLAPWCSGAIEHVGSTAIPGLAAKPIIDLQAAVTDLTTAEAVAQALAPHDWRYVPPELDQRPYRRFFVKVVADHRVAHLHLLLHSGARWSQQRVFRDTLRVRPDLIHAYAQLKTELAKRHRTDREAYTAGKQRFVQDVLTRFPEPHRATAPNRAQKSHSVHEPGVL